MKDKTLASVIIGVGVLVGLVIFLGDEFSKARRFARLESEWEGLLLEQTTGSQVGGNKKEKENYERKLAESKDGIFSDGVEVGIRLPRESFSPEGNFRYHIECKPDTDSCGGFVTDLRKNVSVFVPTFQTLAWYEEEYLVGLPTLMGGSQGLFFVPLGEMEKLEQFQSLQEHFGFFQQAFQISNTAYSPERAFIKNVNLVSDGVYYTRFYPELGRFSDSFYDRGLRRSTMIADQGESY
ncbi:MAG: hypothetical protein AMXMBFR44_3210 [Candidatus Campbellbacteria bacterium]